MLLFFISKVSAQTLEISQDTVHYQSSGILYKGVHYNKPNQIASILLKEPNEQITPLLESYKSNRATANVLGFIGGFGIGWTLGGAISGKSFNTGIFASGAGVLIIAFIVNGSANNKLRQAVMEYNKKLMSSKISLVPVFYQRDYHQLNVGIALRF
ncbi:MAG: hypothetical protein MUF58_02615 [Arcicella sp.]|nr:hypothetical protein [Arcicella sp.]